MNKKYVLLLFKIFLSNYKNVTFVLSNEKTITSSLLNEMMGYKNINYDDGSWLEY